VQRNERGDALIEFVFLGIPVIFITLSIIEVSLAMWQFHSLAYTVAVAARYASTHGVGCTQNGNSCTITVGTIANLLSSQAPALSSSKLDATLSTNGVTTTCNPVSSCFSNSAQYPDSSNNAVGDDVKIVVTYPISNPLPMFWPGAGKTTSSVFTLGATSRQRILF
jgi:Flp pilus assembly protein TadG